MEQYKNIAHSLCEECNPDREKTIKLIQRLNNGEDVMEEIIKQNSKLIMKFAWNYSLSCNSLTADDLFQSGVIGLMTAVKRFDPSLGYAFSTYATYWIKQSMAREIDRTDKTVRIPIYLEDKMRKLNKARELLMKSNKMENVENLQIQLKTMYKDETFSIEEIEKFLSITNIMSLDCQLYNDKDSSYNLGSLIKSQNDVFNEVYESEMNNEIRNALNDILDDREKDVIFKRFGFYDGRCYTLQEIGNEYGITRERIRQIESRAIKKIKNKFPRMGLTKARYEEDFFS